jgi:hypothetical protein
MSSPAPHQQALDALLSFGRSGRLEDRTHYGSHWLGDSPHDAGYQVRVTLAVDYDAASKLYTARLMISETRYEGGQVSQRHEREMPYRQLGEATATRFSAKRAETLYNETLAELKRNPQPLIDLLQEEADRS